MKYNVFNEASLRSIVIRQLTNSVFINWLLYDNCHRAPWSFNSDIGFIHGIIELLWIIISATAGAN